MNSAVNPQVTPDFKNRFQEAVELKNQGRSAEAEQKFKDLLVINPASASVHALLAGTLGDQGQLTQATASFRKAVELAPKSEMASLGLFHTLVESGDREGAIAEMTRFQSLSNSEEYLALAQQLKVPMASENAVLSRRTDGTHVFRRTPDLAHYQEIVEIDSIVRQSTELKQRLVNGLPHREYRIINQVREPNEVYFRHRTGEDVFWWSGRKWEDNEFFHHLFGLAKPGVRKSLCSVVEFNVPIVSPFHRRLGGFSGRHFQWKDVAGAPRQKSHKRQRRTCFERAILRGNGSSWCGIHT